MLRKCFKVVLFFTVSFFLCTGNVFSAEEKNLEKKVKELEDFVWEISDRLDKSELHTATDRISLGVELKSTAWSIDFDDARKMSTSVLPSGSTLMDAFFTDYNAANPFAGGLNGATKDQFKNMMAAFYSAGMVPNGEKYDSKNDIMYTTKFRLNMKGKVNKHLNFKGRLAVYKVWGDSSGVNFNNNGSIDNTYLDGNTVGIPHGDIVHLERAYMNYKNTIGSVPYNFSLGRRPSTDGPFLHYKANSLEGGSPFGSIINWQFDGASLTFSLEDLTNIPGASFKLCYGVGFESDYGNQNSNTGDSKLDDVHLMGFISNLYDNGKTGASVMYAYAPDLTDGFAGQTVMPFIVSKEDGKYYFNKNYGAFISRSQPTTNLGSWQAASLNLKTSVAESTGGINLFANFAWSNVDPNGNISEIPIYELMNQGLMSGKNEDGYLIWVGAVFPMPFNAKLGMEYNRGSKYWLNFTGAEDTMAGSKLAARGDVYELYYHQPVSSDNLFITIGGRYYDYEYTGSGNPLVNPVKVSEADSMNLLFSQPDKVTELYLSATMRF